MSTPLLQNGKVGSKNRQPHSFGSLIEPPVSTPKRVMSPPSSIDGSIPVRSGHEQKLYPFGAPSTSTSASPCARSLILTIIGPAKRLKGSTNTSTANTPDLIMLLRVFIIQPFCFLLVTP